MTTLYLALAAAVLALFFALLQSLRINRQKVVNKRMAEIAAAIREGAMAFLMREYKLLAIFIVILGAVLYFGLDKKETLLNEGLYTSLSFLVGAICSLLAGFIGMRVATKANVRTAEAAQKGLGQALRMAFASGSVMGLSVVGLGILGLTSIYLLLTSVLKIETAAALELLTGFSLGASSIALFARVGGGIYTKAADVGADLVGKLEAGIPEDDPRNPAVIADNVGDNVGDVAGMGADLFESYVGSIIAALVLGFAAFGMAGVYLPFMIATIGIVSSLVGSLLVRVNEKGGNVEHKIHKALKMGLWVASFLVIVISFFAIRDMMPVESAMGIFWAMVAGLVAGIIIGLLTEYYTSASYKPVQNLAASAQTGAATNIIAGLGLGYQSTLFPVLFICVAILVAYSFAGLYGIAISAVGMLSTLGVSLAIDAYGPVADNAGGIAEMAAAGPEVRQKTDALDSAGNTTAAIGKGFAIGSAALTALALFAAYTAASGLEENGINIASPKVIVGLLIGGMLPFLFSALTMGAVGRAAFSMIEEVRRQFKEIKGLMEGKAKPDNKTCVDIATKAAIREMIIPGLLAVISPLAIGFLLGAEALGGLLAGALVTGVMLAISMANSGGAWDNAKKYVETGKLGGKGSATHKATVVGDTVGDPFKDTSGPSINILIKLMTVISLIFAGLFGSGLI